jgi:hypothetical protein
MMDGSAWQVLPGLQAWQITQIPRRPPARQASAADQDQADRGAALLAGSPCWARLAGIRDSLLASADLAGLPYGLALMGRCAGLEEILAELPAASRALPAMPGGAARLPPGAAVTRQELQQSSGPFDRPRSLDGWDTCAPAWPFDASSRLVAALARPPARELPGVRFVLRPDFDVTPETAVVCGIGSDAAALRDCRWPLDYRPVTART